MLSIYKLKKNIVKNNKFIDKKGEYAQEMKHYPPATKEWFNSVYNYNKNNIKYLPARDLYITKLIKSYFNLINVRFHEKTLLYKSSVSNKSMNKVFVGKPELKHTNDKVVITLFIYNRELISYIKRIEKIKSLNKFKSIQKRIDNIIKRYKFNDVNKLKALKNQRRYKQFKNDNLNIFKNFLISNILTSKIPYLDKNFKQKILLLRSLAFFYLNIIKHLNTKYLDIKYLFFKIENLPLLGFVKNILTKLKVFLYIKRAIIFNKSKFNSILIIPLKTLIENIYSKKVEFNIVSLKRYNLNSSILTQILANKLKDRNNRVLVALERTLNRVNMPYARKLEYPGKPSINKNIQNLVIRNNINNIYYKKIPSISLFNSKFLHKNLINKVSINKILEDRFNNLLKVLYPKQYTMGILKKNIPKEKVLGTKIQLNNSMSINDILYVKLRKLENTVLDNLKNKVITGLRIEASGRLSKRLIAARTVFKMRQKGTIRNINSSYRTIPSVLLRGYLTSNLDFSKSKNKTPTGSFGLKGWVSTM